MSRTVGQSRPDALEDAIASALSELGTAAGADRAFVFLFDDARTVLKATHVWRAEGVGPIERLLALDALEHAAVHEWLRRREELNLIDTSLRAAVDPELCGLLAAHGIGSLAAVPLIGAGETFGFLGLAAVSVGGAWPVADVALLQAVAAVLATALAHRATQQALAEARLRAERMTGTLLGYTADPRQNVQRLVRIFGELVGADRVTYDRLDGERPCTRCSWSRPSVVVADDETAKPVVLRVIRTHRHRPVLAHEPGGAFTTSFGAVVSSGDEPVGALLAWFAAEWTPLPSHEALIGALASAIGVEEERERALTSLSASEEQAKRSLSLLEATLESTADALLVTDAAGGAVRYNAKFVELWGRVPRRGLALGAVRGRVVDADEFLRRVQWIYGQPLAESIDVIEFEDGRRLELYSQPQRLEGQAVGRVWSFRDITARTRAEAQLRLLAAAVEQACEAIVVVSPSCTVEYANPAFVAAAGVSQSELSGRDVRELVEPPPEITGAVDPWSALRRGDVWTGNLVLRGADGTGADVTAVLSPVRDGDTIRHYVGVLRDVTLENELQEQLRQSQKMESLGQLAGGIAHDFNNLLTAIGGYTELLRRAVPGDVAQEFVREMEAAVQRAAALTRQLLAFGRKQVLKPADLDLNVAIDRVQSMLRRLIGADIELVVEAEPELDLVRVDPGQVDQVIMNLVVNARDAMPQGGRLSIATANVSVDALTGERSVMPPGRYVRITVRDTGVGIDEPTRSRIFEPFFTTKGPGKGTGLGLSTVYGIVKQSRGFIFVDSAPGSGSTFEIYFPRVARPAAAGTSPAFELELPQAAAPSSTGSLVILLAEDEPQVREIARTVLEDEGHRVLCAADGEQALQIASDYPEPIALLVTDVVMPRLGGAELSKRLRKERPGIRVLFLSGYEGHTIARRGILAEGTAFLQKPFTLSELRAKVAETLADEALVNPRR